MAKTASVATKERKPRPGKIVLERVREMAISFEFLPDESINEAALAQKLGVSRSPVRDALNRLVTEGLINFRPNYGFFARTLSEAELYDMAEARLCLELEALRLAFERGTLDERKGLLEYWQGVDDQLDGMDPREAARHDEQFHMHIFAMARNATLTNLMNIINARIRFIREIEVEMPMRKGADFKEHFTIARALVSGKESTAHNAMKRHLTFTPETAKAVLREGILRIYQTRT